MIMCLRANPLPLVYNHQVPSRKVYSVGLSLHGPEWLDFFGNGYNINQHLQAPNLAMDDLGQPLFARLGQKPNRRRGTPESKHGLQTGMQQRMSCPRGIFVAGSAPTHLLSDVTAKGI